MHVYRMQQLIKERAKDTVVNVAQRNSLYQTIARLERDALVRVQRTSREENRPERAVYQITDSGRTTLDVWLADMLSTPAREFPEFPAALAFMALLPAARVKELLRTRKAELERHLRAARTATARAAEAGLPRLFLLEDEYKEAIIVAEIDWIGRVVADLELGKLAWSQAWIRSVARRMERSQSESPKRKG